ncbi:MAG: protein-glutamate O-methyltransferase CheR [bacterium]
MATKLDILAAPDCESNSRQQYELHDAEFETLRNLVYLNFGINLTEQKRALVLGRLQRVLRQRGIDSFEAYCQFLVDDRSGKALAELANRISTNHTYFYREKDHFDYFVAEVLPAMTANIEDGGNKDLRVWCAGCSSGEEPYTLVMLMMEFFGMKYPQWDAGILATDISGTALQAAQVGEYDAEQLRKMPPALKHKYFSRDPAGKWHVNPEVKKEVTYRRLNLMDKAFQFKKSFDIVFCRNVMIYFDNITRDSLVRRFADCMKPGGYLFIGHSETLGRDNKMFGYVKPAVYRKLEK